MHEFCYFAFSYKQIFSLLYCRCFFLVYYLLQNLKTMPNLILQVMNLIGDVKGKVAVMVDDMIDTAGE